MEELPVHTVLTEENMNSGLLLCGINHGYSKDDERRDNMGIDRSAEHKSFFSDKYVNNYPFRNSIVKWFRLWGYKLADGPEEATAFDRAIIQTNWLQSCSSNVRDFNAYKACIDDHESFMNTCEKLRPKVIFFFSQTLLWAFLSEELSNRVQGIFGRRVGSPSSIQKDVIKDGKKRRRFKFHFQSLCDALHAALALLGRGLDNDLVLIPIEPKYISDNEIKARRVTSNINTDDFDIRSSYGFDVDDLMWNVATNLVQNDVLLYASLFVRESLRDYQFLGDEIEETILTYEVLPETISEGVKIENAIHNSYKAIEAIHGGNLPQDKRKIVRKFHEIGIDLTELVGYSLGVLDKEPAIDKLMRLRNCRDSKSAHGRIGVNRKSTFYELMDFQELARYLVRHYVENQTGVSFNS